MAEPVFKMIELVGTSQDSISDAIENAIERAAATIRQLSWFEVTQIRGQIADNGIRQYQVTLKAGFTLEDQ
ncbi:MAG: dodecin domain-containing protein [Acetobacteraceae bacterium]|nr:dodecin domain-containing protein [Acetobacteraceae bacterium]